MNEFINSPYEEIPDQLVIYGKIRLPLLFNGFEEIEWVNIDKNYLLGQPLRSNAINPVVVLKKTVNE